MLKDYVWPKDYPLPRFVMLEVTELEDGRIQVSLRDKKNHDTLDCDTVTIWENANITAWTRFYCDVFKANLKRNGVI